MAVFLIILRILFGVLFVAAGAAKLFGVPMMVQEFGLVGLGQWFRYATGLIEIAGALLLVRPRTVTPGAVLLACVCIGAAVAQATRIHMDAIHAIVMAAILGWIAYRYRGAAGIGG